MKALSYNALFGGYYGAERHDDYRHNSAQEANATVRMSNFQNRFRLDDFFMSVALLKSRNEHRGIINGLKSDKAFEYSPPWAEFALEPGL